MRSGDNGHRALSTLGERVSRRIEKAGNGADCLGKGGGLAGHGDEEMGGCGEDMVSEPVAKSLQPMRQLGGLVEEDVVTRRDEAHGRQGAQRVVGGEFDRDERIVLLSTGVGFAESLKQFGVVAIALGIVCPRWRDTRVESGDRIDGHNPAYALGREGCGEGKVASGAVASHRHLGRVAAPRIGVLAEIGKGAAAVVERSRKDGCCEC